jgi:hypothetical protein
MSRPAPAGLRPAAGRSRARPGVSERMSSLRWSRWETYAGPWRTLLPAGRPIPPGYAPRGASRPQQPRPTGPPRGSGAAAPSGALRAIDRRGRVLGGPAARAAFGGSPKPALVATQGGTARPGPHVFCLASTDTACTGAERRRRHPDRWVWGRLGSAAAQGRKGAAPLPGAAPALLCWPLAVCWLGDWNGGRVRDR